MRNKVGENSLPGIDPKWMKTIGSYLKILVSHNNIENANRYNKNEQMAAILKSSIEYDDSPSNMCF